MKFEFPLLQISRKRMPLHLPFGQLFTAKRNRVEFVCDFPEGDDAEVISSLQLHPQGWVAVTRNLSADEESEVGALTIATFIVLLHVNYILEPTPYFQFT